MSIHQDAQTIIDTVLRENMPDEAVRRALKEFSPGKGKLCLVAIGKAAWSMAKTACDVLDERIAKGIVITKYDHSRGDISDCEVYEAGHPVPDENSFRAGRRALELVSGLEDGDTVLFLVSGGGSALFEVPLVTPEQLADVTGQLLRCGADITEINTVRKRLSAVKGGRFAEACLPARVYAVILSDVIDDRLDIIASGPACPDVTTCAEALAIVEKYALDFPPEVLACLETETPKTLSNVETAVTGSVRELCRSARRACERLGYEATMLTDCLCCQAKEAGSFLASIAKSHEDAPRSVAFIAGGETVVKLTGTGKGGRNQELALAAAEGIAGMRDTVVFSLGSDGTDGPTDAAGGIVDGDTLEGLRRRGVTLHEALQNNDAYNALKAVDGLLVTGATGTNVNDVALVLIKR